MTNENLEDRLNFLEKNFQELQKQIKVAAAERQQLQSQLEQEAVFRRQILSQLEQLGQLLRWDNERDRYLPRRTKHRQQQQ